MGILAREATESWEDAWNKKDFSWNGLINKQPWGRFGGGQLQESLRLLHGGMTDDQLASDGWLVAGVDGQIFHVAYVPDQWIESGRITVLSKDELRSKKDKLWNNLFESRLRETVEGTLVGFRLTETASQVLMNQRRFSLEWCSLTGNVSPQVGHTDRLFKNCCIYGVVKYSGSHKSTRLPVHKFRHCAIVGGVLARDFEGLSELSFETCLFSDNFHAVSSKFLDVNLQNCSASIFSLDRCEFSGDFALRSSNVDDLKFRNTTFLADFVLSDTEFSEVVAFWSCDFQKRATFSNNSWPTPGLHRAVANGSKFWGITEIAGKEPPPIQFFDQAYFKEGVSLQNFTERQWRETFEQASASTATANVEEFVAQAHIESIEAGCRNLRKIAEADGNIHAEHLWRLAEIKIRRRRPDCTALERIFSYAYGAFADYGLSIGRPFASLGLVICLFSVIYGWLAGDAWIGNLDWAGLQEGFGYSLNRTLPIGVFADDLSAWRKGLLGQAGEISGIAVRTLATLQSILSAVLIFLGVMAIRRKFRLS